MQGPQPSGHWTNHVSPQSYGPLEPGARYEVRTAFVDHDGRLVSRQSAEASHPATHVPLPTTPDVLALLRWDVAIWLCTCAGAGVLVGALLGMLVANLPATAGLALAGAVLGVLIGQRVWRAAQWRILQAALPKGTPASVVVQLLGEPTSGLDVFDTRGDVAKTLVFRPARYAAAKFQGPLVCDIDGYDCLWAVRRVRG